MQRILMSLLVVGVLLPISVLAEDCKEALIKQDRKRIEGTWKAVALTVNGNRTAGENAEKITVVNGDDGSWSVRVDGKEIGKGTSTYDPTKKPRWIDFTATEGNEKGKTYLGIYELGAKKRKLCFVGPGKERPTLFVSNPGSEWMLVEFERVEE